MIPIPDSLKEKKKMTNGKQNVNPEHSSEMLNLEKKLNNEEAVSGFIIIFGSLFCFVAAYIGLVLWLGFWIGTAIVSMFCSGNALFVYFTRAVAIKVIKEKIEALKKNEENEA